MMSTRSFKQKLTKVLRHWRDEQYDVALSDVEELLKSWPGNAHLYILWASLVQLQDDPTHSLDEAKKALQRAVEVDANSPAGTIELGHYLDAVEDNPRAASKAFSEGIRSARRLLMDGLLGQARALLQLDKKEEALKCLMESLYLANIDYPPAGGKSPDAVPDILLRDSTGQILAIQLKGPFAVKIEDLLQQLFPQRITTQWSIKLAKGWRDAAPTDVRETFELHQEHDKTCVFASKAGAHLSELSSLGDLMFYGNANEQEAINRILGYIGAFLGNIEVPAYDVVSLVFVNFKPELSPFNREPGVTVELASITDGLREFCNSVTGSLCDSGVFSTCEWAMLSCSRIG